MTTLDDFFSAVVVERNLGKQSSNIQTQFFALAEFSIKENVAKFANCTGGKLRMAVLNVGKVAQSSCDLDKYHGFSIGRAVELKQLSYSE